MYPVMYSLSVRLPPACSSERSNDGSADKYAALLFSGLPRKNSRPSVHSGVAVMSTSYSEMISPELLKNPPFSS
jgi:hypothetical protein